MPILIQVSIYSLKLMIPDDRPTAAFILTKIIVKDGYCLCLVFYLSARITITFRIDLGWNNERRCFCLGLSLVETWKLPAIRARPKRICPQMMPMRTRSEINGKESRGFKKGVLFNVKVDAIRCDKNGCRSRLVRLVDVRSIVKAPPLFL